MPSTSSSGGEGGTGGDATGGGGMGGNATCTPGDLTTCGAGEYCNADTKKCVSCADLSRFSFGIPSPIDLTVPPQTSGVWFPRATKDDTLYFQLRSQSSTNEDIAHALPDPKKFAKWQSAVVEPLPFNQQTSKESAPLYLESGAGLEMLVDSTVDPTQPVLVFDSTRFGGRKVFAGNPGQQALSQVSLPGAGTANFQLAIAQQANPIRLWYISNASGEQKLYTLLPGDSPVPTPLMLNDSGGCEAVGELAPWVTPDGKHMVFHAVELGPNCSLQGNAPYRLYHTALTTDGLQETTAKAEPIFPGDAGDYQTPSMSQDLCKLYFTRINLGAEPMIAVRE